ncbi:carbohydrate ABC transporter permease [Paenibacillaceae bacterium WGS1546]|uniref:carbohydrate ABC transporter permease n=1 Tax=Cohnella sp. WGS1546 TaxID=3366810 RepID=UPI00372D6D12
MGYANKVTAWFTHGVLLLISCFCLLPFLLLLMSSVTDEETILQNGYAFFPEKYSLSAYSYLISDAEEIVRAYGITVFITVVGTAFGLLITALLAYPLSRKDLPLRNWYSLAVFFTLLFSGGLVPTYLVYTQLLDLKNTVWSLIVPVLLMNGFNVMLMRTFFSMTIPPSLLESANIDGAGEWRTLFRIVLPLSLPVLATVALFQAIGYWNDWFNGMIFLTDSSMYSIQNMLNRILLDIQFLTTISLNSSQSEDLARIPKETVRMALAVIGVVPILAVYPFFQRYFVRGLTVGAVKG